MKSNTDNTPKSSTAVKTDAPRSPLMLRMTRSFYAMAGALFLLWVAFFDSNSLVSQYGRIKKKRDLERQKSFYLDGIKEAQSSYKELTTKPEELEKYAREKYLFHSQDEEVFLVDEQELDKSN